MMKDLYACDLDRLTFEDVDGFIALDIREGTRIDYKVDVPQDLGDIVCAFSNVIGGLVIVGVEDKDGLPVGMPGVPRQAKSDLKTRLVNKICSTVYPRPIFDIGIVASTADPTRDVAVIRVHEGYETPYIFNDRKVAVRVGDKCEYASRLDLERLFRRRELGPGATDVREDRNIGVLVTHEENQTQVASDTWLKCWLWPTQPLAVRFDRRIEAAFRDVVSRSFPDMTGIEIDDRHGAWVDLRFRSTNVIDLNAHWRLTSSGSIGFVIQPFRTDLQAIPLPNVVQSAARFLLSASVVLQALNWHGRVSAEASLATMDKRITSNHANGGLTIDGIVNIGARTNRGSGNWFETFASPASIEAG
ncbi:MAG: AlbA family DNA-binding domain-containing protein, partial [bacterium]